MHFQKLEIGISDKLGLRGAYHQTALSAEGTRCDTVDSDITHCGTRTS